MKSLGVLGPLIATIQAQAQLGIRVPPASSGLTTLAPVESIDATQPLATQIAQAKAVIRARGGLPLVQAAPRTTDSWFGDLLAAVPQLLAGLTAGGLASVALNVVGQTLGGIQPWASSTFSQAERAILQRRSLISRTSPALVLSILSAIRQRQLARSM